MSMTADICALNPTAGRVLHFADRGVFRVRRIGRSDLEMQRTFFRGLSADTRYWRFMGPKQDISEPLLRYLTAADGKTHVAFMAEVVENGRPLMVAEARYIVDAKDAETCEFALSVSDGWQGRGLAARLLALLEDHAQANGLRRMVADALGGNIAMVELAKKAGYTVALNCRDPRAVRLSKALFRREVSDSVEPRTAWLNVA